MPSRNVSIIVRAVGATNASRQLRGVAASLGQVDKRGRRASRSIRGVGDAAARLRGAAWRGTMRVAGGLTAIGAAAAVTGIKFNAMIEQQTTAFTGFLGSAQKARDYVDSLYTIAKNTPFEFTDVLKGTRTLVAYGLSAEQARKTFTGLGDAIAATGGGADQIRRASIALGQIQAAGVLHAQDLNQLIQAGVVSLPLLTKRMGTNTKQFRKDMKENKISAEDFFTAITESWENDPMYKGAAAKQAKTFNGQLEKLRDTAKQTMGAITEPLFEGLRKKGLPALSAFSQDLTDIWKQKKLTLDQKLDMSGESFRKRITPVIDDFAKWWKTSGAGDRLAGMFEDVLVAAGNRLPGALQKSFGTAIDAWWKLGPAGKAVTAGILLTKLGITRALWNKGGGLLMRRLLGGKGKGGKGGGLFGGQLGTLTNPAYVIVLDGAGFPGGPGGKPKNNRHSYRNKKGQYAKKPGRFGRVGRVFGGALTAAQLAAEAAGGGSTAGLAAGVSIPLLIAMAGGNHNYQTVGPGARQDTGHVPLNPAALHTRVPDPPRAFQGQSRYGPSDIPILGQMPGLNRNWALHVHTHIDGKEVANSVTKHAKQKKATR